MGMPSPPVWMWVVVLMAGTTVRTRRKNLSQSWTKFRKIASHSHPIPNWTLNIDQETRADETYRQLSGPPNRRVCERRAHLPTPHSCTCPPTATALNLTRCGFRSRGVPAPFRSRSNLQPNTTTNRSTRHTDRCSRSFIIPHRGAEDEEENEEHETVGWCSSVFA